MASTLKLLGLNSAPVTPYLNTGTLIDLSVGMYQLGVGNKWLLNGGLNAMSGMVGRAGDYKTTVIDSLMTLIMHMYPGIEGIKYDTENNAFGMDRFITMFGSDKILELMLMLNRTSTDTEEFHSIIKQIAYDREKNNKSYMVETPFEYLGKPLMIPMPILIDIDSLSSWSAVSVDDNLMDKSVEDSKLNTSDMQDGKYKTKLMTQLARLSHKYGMYFIFTAHVDDAFNLDPYNSAPKQLQHMKQNDRIKRVGSQFEFLTNVLFQNISPSALVTKDTEKTCVYPDPNGSSDKELSTVTTKVLRCKTNGAGTEVPLVISHKYGILPALTNYHFLKTNKWGLTGSDRSPRSPFHPEEGLGRTEVRKKLNNSYELRRGLEILAQLKFMNLNWTHFPYSLPDTADEFVKLLESNKSIKVNDILNSRGHWTFKSPVKNKEADVLNDREYMSTMDVIQLLQKGA